MGNSKAPIRIVRAKNTREWFVEQEAQVLCSLIETSHIWAHHKVHLLRSPKGNWQVEPNGNWKNLTATKIDDASSIAEIRFAVSTNRLGTNPVYDLHFGKESYKRFPSGNRWRVRSSQGDVYEYGIGWQDSDSTRRICYHLSLLGELPEEVGDLLLVMPLFWSGMTMYEPGE